MSNIICTAKRRWFLSWFLVGLAITIIVVPLAATVLNESTAWTLGSILQGINLVGHIILVNFAYGDECAVEESKRLQRKLEYLKR